jgi:trigger factor
MEYVQNEPMAAAQLRAPLYEDKVVDFLFDKAEVSDREVTREELQAAIEAEEAAPTPAKKAAAKKPSAKKAAPAEDKPAKEAKPKAEAKPKVEPKPKADPKPKAEAAAEKSPAKKAPAKKTAAKS